MRTRISMAAAAAFAALSLAVPVVAQNCGPGIGPCGPGYGAGYGYGPGQGPGMMGRGGPGGYGDPTARADIRLEWLRTQLALDESQQAAWQAYAAAVRVQADAMAQGRAQMWNDGGTAPERAARRAQLMAEHAAQHAGTAEALRGLYAVLNAEQRATVDRFSMPGGPFARR